MKSKLFLVAIVCLLSAACGTWIAHQLISNWSQLGGNKPSSTPALSDSYITGSVGEAEDDVWKKIIEIEIQEAEEMTSESAFRTATLLATCFSQLGRIAEVQGKKETAKILYDKAIVYAEKGDIANELRAHFSSNQEICYFLSDSVDRVLEPKWRKDAGLTEFIDFKSP